MPESIRYPHTPLFSPSRSGHKSAYLKGCKQQQQQHNRLKWIVSGDVNVRWVHRTLWHKFKICMLSHSFGHLSGHNFVSLCYDLLKVLDPHNEQEKTRKSFNELWPKDKVVDLLFRLSASIIGLLIPLPLSLFPLLLSLFFTYFCLFCLRQL